MLPKFSLLANIHEIYHKKYVQKFSNTVLGYKKRSKPKYFSRFKKYNFSAFKRIFNRPSMCLRSQNKSCCLAASVSKNVTFEENRPFFTTKIDFFNLLYIAMGCSLSGSDRLRGPVSTLKPNRHIR